MFEHSYEDALDPADGDWPAPLVVHCDQLNTATLSALPAYLIDTMPLRYRVEDLNTHLDARPLVFEFAGDTRLSERALWSLIVEMHWGADAVTSYVDAVIAYTPANDALGFYSCLDVVGQDPIYAYFDRFLRRAFLDTRGDVAPLVQVIDCFLRFLGRCDLDHETFQEGYIAPCLRFLKWKDADRLLELLYLRLTRGQNVGVWPDRRGLLTGDGFLKRIVDRYLGDSEEAWHLHESVVELCCAVYGSNDALTDDVLAYCRSRAEFDEDDPRNRRNKGLSLLRRVRDADWALWPRALDTGFHRFDKASGEWTRLAYDEKAPG